MTIGPPPPADSPSRPDSEELDAVLAYRGVARALLRGEVPHPDDVEAFLVSCGRHEAAYAALAQRLESALAERDATAMEVGAAAGLHVALRRALHNGDTATMRDLLDAALMGREAPGLRVVAEDGEEAARQWYLGIVVRLLLDTAQKGPNFVGFTARQPGGRTLAVTAQWTDGKSPAELLMAERADRAAERTVIAKARAAGKALAHAAEIGSPAPDPDAVELTDEPEVPEQHRDAARVAFVEAFEAAMGRRMIAALRAPEA